MKKIGFLVLGIASCSIMLQSCTRELKPYAIVSLDVADNTIIATMDTPVTEKEFLHTAMYILDSTNNVLKLNKAAKIGIQIYNNPEAASLKDSNEMIGKYEYYFDTKQETIHYRK